jgi:uroporphyrinogen decarboxylase
MMDSKELVYRALAFEPVERVPYAMGFTVRARERFLASAGGRELYERIDNDVVFTPVIRVEWGVCDASGRYVDEFGVVWDRSIDVDIGIPRPMVGPDTLGAYRWPEPRAAGRFDRLAESLRRQPRKFHLMTFDFSLYERAWSLRGMENLLLDMVEREAFVEALLDKIVGFNLAVIEAGLAACPEIDGVFFGDDFGSQAGVVMGPGHWRRLIQPRLARQYGAVKAAGKKVFIHSCGRVQELFDDLVALGVDCFNPFQPEVMDIYDVFNRYHGRLAFWGGISTQRLLPYGGVGEVEAEVDRLLRMGRRGGYIIAPAHAMPGDVRCENVAAMVRKIVEQGIK